MSKIEDFNGRLPVRITLECKIAQTRDASVTNFVTEFEVECVKANVPPSCQMRQTFVIDESTLLHLQL